MSILKYGKKEFFANKVMWINNLINDVEEGIKFGIIEDKKDDTAEFYHGMVNHKDLTVKEVEFVLNLNEEEMERYQRIDGEFHNVCTELDWIIDVHFAAAHDFLGEDVFDEYTTGSDEDDYRIYTFLPIEELYELSKDVLSEKGSGLEEFKAAFKFDIEDRCHKHYGVY